MAAAGPWVRDPGAWYAKAGVSSFRAGAYVAPGASGSADGPIYQGTTASLYAEAGIVDGLQFVGELPFTWSSNHFDGSYLRYREDGPGSLRAGLGATLPRSVLPLSLHVIGRVPLFDHAERLPLDPALGEEQADLDVVAAAGASLPIGGWRAWGALEGGVRVRTGVILVRPATVIDEDEAFLYRTQLGLLPRWRDRELGWLVGEANGAVGVADPRAMHAVAGGVAVSLLAGLHLELGVNSVLAARRESRGWGASVGLSHVRRRARRQSATPNEEEEMNRTAVLAALAAPALVACNGADDPEEHPHGEFARFIAVDELAADLDAFVILDNRDPEVYSEGHIEGAINAPWQTFASVGVGIPGDPDWGTLLSPAEIAAALGALGVDPTKPIVAYTDPAGWGEDGRVAWSLASIGIDDVRMLDGGFPAWVNTGNETTTAVPSPAATTVEVVAERLGEIDVTTAQMLEAVEGDSHLIIDARAAEEYDGAVLYGEARGGHIPGAISLPFVENLNGDGTLKPEEDLVAMYEGIGVAKGETVYVYCTKGIRSAHTFMVLTMLGYDARNYDASFYSWAGDESLPLE